MESGGAGDGARQGPNGEDPGPSPFGPLELPRDETEVLPRFDEYGGYEEPHHPQQPHQPQPPYQQQYSPNPQYAPPPPPPGPVPPRPPGPPPGQPQYGAAQGQPQAPPAAGPADATQVFPAHLFRDAPQPGPEPGSPPTPPAYGAHQSYQAPPAHQPPPAAPPGYPTPQPYSPQYAPPAVPPHGPAPGGYQDQGPAGRSRTPLIAAGVGGIVVIAAIALFASGAFGKDDTADKAAPTAGASSKPATSVAPEQNDTAQPPPKADPTAGQASAVDELLKVSAGSRQIVAQAVLKIQNCTDPAAGAASLTQAAEQRDQQVAGLGGLKTDKLDRGSDLVTGLREAWTASAESDRELAAWGTEMAQGGCTDGKAKYTDHKRSADRASSRATTAKNKVVGIWNPIALGNNLKKRGANEI